MWLHETTEEIEPRRKTNGSLRYEKRWISALYSRILPDAFPCEGTWAGWILHFLSTIQVKLTQLLIVVRDPFRH
jgi:hypothetical protein